MGVRITPSRRAPSSARGAFLLSIFFPSLTLASLEATAVHSSNAAAASTASGAPAAVLAASGGSRGGERHRGVDASRGGRAGGGRAGEGAIARGYGV
eukprot:CAMPEP_0184712736 /NCGR_PEP_ID=MMETSP0314-20130426/3227_1 /TAXON_ID=38298 /ORGANISM="Rhodella maculata, Strain CCMP 736" /LENGTH=96 /DNA_ID=CAMNT_0027175245 /DNA_START=318 /DNA_END=604 /DNA_ORIENTATION=-